MALRSAPHHAVRNNIKNVRAGAGPRDRLASSSDARQPIQQLPAPPKRWRHRCTAGENRQYKGQRIWD